MELEILDYFSFVPTQITQFSQTALSSQIPQNRYKSTLRQTSSQIEFSLDLTYRVKDLGLFWDYFVCVLAFDFWYFDLASPNCAASQIPCSKYVSTLLVQFLHLYNTSLDENTKLKILDYFLFISVHDFGVFDPSI